MYTPEQWKEHEQMQNALNEIGEDYLTEFFGSWNISLEHASIDGDTIFLECWVTCMGHGESESHSIPLHYLWTEDWIQEEQMRIKKEKQQKEIDDLAKKHAQVLQKMADEKETYQKLKEKYGDD